MRSDGSNSSAPSSSSQPSLELSFVLRARVKGTLPVSMTTGIHHSALPVRNFLSKLCLLLCPRRSLSLKGWERERAHSFNHRQGAGNSYCLLKAEETQTAVLQKRFLFSNDLL